MRVICYDSFAVIGRFDKHEADPYPVLNFAEVFTTNGT